MRRPPEGRYNRNRLQASVSERSWRPPKNMAKIKLTKNELKIQRDALKRFERYLPTLQLKKQQLQMEVRQNRDDIAAMDAEMAALTERSKQVIALFSGNDNGGLSDIIGVCVVGAVIVFRALRERKAPAAA